MGSGIHFFSSCTLNCTAELIKWASLYPKRQTEKKMKMTLHCKLRALWQIEIDSRPYTGIKELRRTANFSICCSQVFQKKKLATFCFSLPRVNGAIKESQTLFFLGDNNFGDRRSSLLFKYTPFPQFYCG